MVMIMMSIAFGDGKQILERVRRADESRNRSHSNLSVNVIINFDVKINLIVQIVAFHEWQELRRPAPAWRTARSVRDPTGWQFLVSGFKVMNGNAKLPHVARALHASRGFSSCLDGR